MRLSQSHIKHKSAMKLHKNKVNSTSENFFNKKALHKAPSLSDFIDKNSKNYFLIKNKNILHDYEEFLKVKEERKNGILFSSVKKLSYEERKKNETYNMYNKSPFKDDPRLIISNYKILKENSLNENNKLNKKNKILGVEEGLIKLPKLNKESNYIEMFHGFNLSDRYAGSLQNKNKENISNDKLKTLNNATPNTIEATNKHKYILSSLRRNKKKNPMFLERGEELLSYFGNLENIKTIENNRNKDNSNDKSSLESLKHKYIEKIGKQKEKYENELNYNYEIKCLDNWDFEHITKKKDLKTDNEFKQFLDEVDNSQMKWLVEIKNDKEQLKLMRRNKHLFNFLIQIDKEQQAIVMQSMNVYKKGFNFDIFDNEEKNNNNKIQAEADNNKKTPEEMSYILKSQELSNTNSHISQVEFYRQVMKEKVKVEEMFHGELRSVAEECYLANLNKKKAIINLFNVTQQFNALNKKEEKTKEAYNKKLMILQLKNKKKDKKKNIIDDPFLNNNNKAKNYLFKYNELKNSLIKKDSNHSNDLLKRNSIYERRDSESSKINNFQQQSEFLAEKIVIENELNAKIKEIKKQKKILNEEYNSLNKEIKFCHNIYKKAKSKLEQRIKH